MNTIYIEEVYPCTKRACHCGWDRPVVIRDINGHPVAIHVDEYVPNCVIGVAP